jgi:hypothetical protein
MIVVWTGVACVTLAIIWLLVVQGAGKIDFIDAFTEWDSDRGVRVASSKKIGEMAALFVSSFYVVYDVVERGSSDLILGLFLGAWVSNALFGKYVKAKAGAIDAAASVDTARAAR